MSNYTIAIIGPAGVGKTQLSTRLTSHRFDNVHKETKTKTQFFVRFQEKGTDCVICLEDTEPSEVLRTEIFSQKFWFEAEEDEFGNPIQEPIYLQFNDCNNELLPTCVFFFCCVLCVA